MSDWTLTPTAITKLDNRFRDPRWHIDWVLVALTMAITGFGLLNIYAARLQVQRDNDFDVYSYVKRQGLAIGLGLIGAVVVCLIDYRKWREYAVLLYAGTALLLGGLFVFGNVTNGAQAWYPVAGGLQFQPSEFAKVTLVLVIAAYVSSMGERMNLPRFMFAITLTVIPMGLTLMQPDLGTAMVFGAILMGTMLIGGAPLRLIGLATLVGVAAVVFILGTDKLKDYQEARLTGFINRTEIDKPFEELTALEQEIVQVHNQIEQTETAIAVGGISGRGFTKGTQTNGRFVPEQHTDFIFSAVAEQFGFIGSAGLIGCYVLIVIRMWRIAMISSDVLGSLIAIGALSLTVFQVFQNIGMNLGIMPVTGIPLPMMSYSPTATIAYLVLLGLVQNVHMRRYS